VTHAAATANCTGPGSTVFGSYPTRMGLDTGRIPPPRR
jgi:hypothetical protein